MKKMYLYNFIIKNNTFLTFTLIFVDIYAFPTFILIFIGIYTLNLDTPSCKRYARDNVNINLLECARSAVSAVGAQT